jgi:hypothetical protein
MLNATLCATERTMCCILENYQEAEGVRVPTVLQPFMGGLAFIPYNKKAVAAFTERKAKEEKLATDKEKKKGGKKEETKVAATTKPKEEESK